MMVCLTIHDILDVIKYGSTKKCKLGHFVPDDLTNYFPG